MDKDRLKQYLSSRYQGCKSFLKEIIFPIFGDDNFNDKYETELLEAQTETQLLAEQTGIKSIKHVGEIPVGVDLLMIFDITVSDRVMLERNRVNIQRVIRRVMESFSSAFMIFHYEDESRWDWRFSYCNKGATDKENTESKRYTFLLGPGQSCRTATENFLKLADKRDDIEVTDIEKAFDVEALSKEFFGKYKDQYEKFVSYITGKKYVKKGNKYEEKVLHDPHPTIYAAFKALVNSNLTEEKQVKQTDKLVRDYIKQMLGRITFLHFLQKKGWMGVSESGKWGEGDQQFMRNLFLCATDEQKANFLDAVLEPLFDRGLDTDRSAEHDIFDTHVALEHGSRVRIPYLNGGLFERNSLDEIDTQFPADFFADLLDFFYQYNFTIDENDPNEAQVGVDPEMLGRIFENLLEDNKDKGAFYTPKEIVRYMCRQSLIAYLQTDIENEAKKNSIAKFVESYDVSLLEGETSAFAAIIDQKLKDVKICDPAIGSGAFPMGLLKELFMCRGAIEHFDNAADIKRHIIQQNIYGVDIERGAVDIARLRFWLSLIVDETSPAALPNLDYKIMQGNSLLESFHGIDLSCIGKATSSDVKIYEPHKNLFGEIDDKQIKVSFSKSEGLKEFQANVKRYYEVTSHKEREEMRGKIEHFVKQSVLSTLEGKMDRNQIMVDNLRVITNPSEKQKKAIAKLERETTELQKQFEEMESMSIINSSFFLWHTWFSDVFSRPSQKGFDIVIGNPPYIKEYENRSAFDGFREISPYYMGKMDLWYGFACHGLDLLCKNGVLCFIAQNNWTTSAGAKILRNKVLEDSQILQLIDFNTYMVFEDASIQTMIMLFSKHNQSDCYTFDYRKLTADAIKQDMLNILHEVESPSCYYLHPSISSHQYINQLLTFSKNDKILERIKANCFFLRDEEIAQGIVFPQDFLNKKNAQKLEMNVGDGVFGLSDLEKNNLNLSEVERNIIKPYYTSEQIHRYYTFTKNSLWMIYTDSKYKNPASLDGYPNIKRHLDKFLSIFTSDNKPYGLHRSRKESFFQGEKIISLRKCSDRPTFSYSNFDCYVSQTYFIIKTERFDMKYLTGLFNSKLIAFWLKNRGKLQGANYQIDKEPLVQIPIKYDNADLQNQIAEEITQIITLKGHDENADILPIEKKINDIVYKLYNLTAEDIKIIEETI